MSIVSDYLSFSYFTNLIGQSSIIILQFQYFYKSNNIQLIFFRYIQVGTRLPDVEVYENNPGNKVIKEKKHTHS